MSTESGISQLSEFNGSVSIVKVIFALGGVDMVGLELIAQGINSVVLQNALGDVVLEVDDLVGRECHADVAEPFEVLIKCRKLIVGGIEGLGLEIIELVKSVGERLVGKLREVIDLSLFSAGDKREHHTSRKNNRKDSFE